MIKGVEGQNLTNAKWTNGQQKNTNSFKYNSVETCFGTQKVTTISVADNVLILLQRLKLDS